MADAGNKQASATSNESTHRAKLRLQYYRSAIATPQKHKKVVKGLGFTHLQQVVEREDTPSIRGMVNRVPHLVRILED